MTRPLNLPEPNICDMNCFYPANHEGRHQFERVHPGYDDCDCVDASTHVAAIKESDMISKKEERENVFSTIVPMTIKGPAEILSQIKLIDLPTDRRIKVYQCGPMAGCTDEEMHGWRDSLKKDYPNINWLDPCDRSYKMQQWRSLVNDDIADIDNADYVLSYYWKTGTGSAMELSYNYYVAKKPSIVVVPGYKSVSPWLRYHADYLVDSFDHAMKIILNDDNTKF